MGEGKHFGEWMEVKEKLHEAGRMTGISEGQIWWAAVGENIGTEINGKSGFFSRPVLVYKKLGRNSFMAIPLTTKDHSGRSWYVPYEFHGKVAFAALAQARVLSVSRLYRKRSIGELSASDFRKVKEGFRKLYY